MPRDAMSQVDLLLAWGSVMGVALAWLPARLLARPGGLRVVTRSVDRAAPSRSFLFPSWVEYRAGGDYPKW